MGIIRAMSDMKITGNSQTKKGKYTDDIINELATHSKNKNITDLYREINAFKKGYQP
jgi:hypothetical protein